MDILRLIKRILSKLNSIRKKYEEIAKREREIIPFNNFDNKEKFKINIKIRYDRSNNDEYMDYVISSYIDDINYEHEKRYHEMKSEEKEIIKRYYDMRFEEEEMIKRYLDTQERMNNILKDTLDAQKNLEISLRTTEEDSQENISLSDFSFNYFGYEITLSDITSSFVFFMDNYGILHILISLTLGLIVTHFVVYLIITLFLRWNNKKNG